MIGKHAKSRYTRYPWTMRASINHLLVLHHSVHITMHPTPPLENTTLLQANFSLNRELQIPCKKPILLLLRVPYAKYSSAADASEITCTSANKTINLWAKRQGTTRYLCAAAGCGNCSWIFSPFFSESNYIFIPDRHPIHFPLLLSEPGLTAVYYRTSFRNVRVLYLLPVVIEELSGARSLSCVSLSMEDRGARRL